MKNVGKYLIEFENSDGYTIKRYFSEEQLKLINPIINYTILKYPKNKPMATKKKVGAIYTYSDSEAGFQRINFNSFEKIKKYINEFGQYGDSDGIVYRNGNEFWEYESKEGKEIIWTPVPKKKVGAKKVVKKTTAARFVKGSKAAKDFMAKLRAKRSEGKYQYGETTKSRDKIIQAKKPGKRVAKKSKNVYYEYRANRADVDQRPKNKGGTLLGINYSLDKRGRLV